MKKDWETFLIPEMGKEYFQKLQRFVDEEYATQTVYPPKEKIYNALGHTGYEEAKVVILGQDPYHGEKQAHGLSFSVADPEAKFPPSLRNIFKELKSDLGITRTERNLTDWADQGLLLLNTVLTVRAGQAGSHRGKGWEKLTDAVIAKLNERKDPVVFVLWGGDAQKKLSLITAPQHKIIKGAHPSPLSAHNGFFGSKPFSLVNSYLKELGKPEIRW
ncbi:MAG: uracil-DNA glycosylase [Desulfuromonadales bacterium]|nr:uracil-DNA glycosylase [Desulfuromonadales bacterium]